MLRRTVSLAALAPLFVMAGRRALLGVLTGHAPRTHVVNGVVQSQLLDF
jgi:hypothetical protein